MDRSISIRITHETAHANLSARLLSVMIERLATS
jgi:hypothetical protein